MLNDNIIIELY